MRAKSILTTRPGDIGTQRQQLKAVIGSLLPACTQPDPVSALPFMAQAIIANPPAHGPLFIVTIILYYFCNF